MTNLRAIANCRLSIADYFAEAAIFSIGNWQLEIGNHLAFSLLPSRAPA
jgi:hypothetical protein